MIFFFFFNFLIHIFNIFLYFHFIIKCSLLTSPVDFSYHASYISTFKFCCCIFSFRVWRGIFIRNSDTMALDCSLLPPIKIFDVYKTWTLAGPCEFLPQNILYNIVRDGTSTPNVTTTKLEIVASGTLMCSLQVGKKSY